MLFKGDHGIHKDGLRKQLIHNQEGSHGGILGTHNGTFNTKDRSVSLDIVIGRIISFFKLFVKK